MRDIKVNCADDSSDTDESRTHFRPPTKPNLPRSSCGDPSSADHLSSYTSAKGSRYVRMLSTKNTLATMQPDTRVQNGQRCLCRKLILKTLGIIRLLLIFRLEPSKYNRAVDVLVALKALWFRAEVSALSTFTTGETSLKLCIIRAAMRPILEHHYSVGEKYFPGNLMTFNIYSNLSKSTTLSTLPYISEITYIYLHQQFLSL